MQKRFTVGPGAGVFIDGKRAGAKRIVDLLTQQAAQIKTLKEWVESYHDESNLIAEERGILIQQKNYPAKRVELAKTRIATVEATNES